MNICHQESNSSHETSFNKNLPLEKLHKFVANRICEPFTPLLLLILPFLGLSYQKALSYKKARRAYGTYRFIYKLCNLITVIACAYQVKTIKGTLYQHHTSNFLRPGFTTCTTLECIFLFIMITLFIEILETVVMQTFLVK